MKRNHHKSLIEVALFFLCVQLAPALEIEVQIHCLDLPICTVPSGRISLFTKDKGEEVTASGSFIADVKTTLKPHEQHLSGDIKIEYQWTAGSLKIIGAKSPQCTVLVQSAEEWGILYPVACTVTVTVGDNVQVYQAEESPSSSKSKK